MTIFLLIRHALTDAVGKYLAGRSEDVPLNSLGLEQAAALSQRLAELPIAAVYSSPLERALRTAEALAQPRRLAVNVLDAINEFDLGAFGGRSVSELRSVSSWEHFNQFRSATRAPAGELMLEVQLRMVQTLEALHRQHGHDCIALVSHADPLRALLGYFLGVPLDLVQRFELEPASLSVLELEDYGARILKLNDTGSVASLTR